MRLNGEIARFDPIALVDEAGNYRPLREIPAEARRCIRCIQVHKQNLTTGDGKTHRVVTYELYDKSSALERDYKRHALMKDRVDVAHRMTLEDLIAGSYKDDE
jgi:hypothetical protein